MLNFEKLILNKLVFSKNNMSGLLKSVKLKYVICRYIYKVHISNCFLQCLNVHRAKFEKKR